MTARPIGLLVMAYGGPQSLDDLPGYLADIRRGRPTTRAVLDEIAHNYRSIGGTSPLLSRTRQQVSALAGRLGTGRFECYLGMRHWAPWIEETVACMVDNGVSHAVSLVLAPHYSRISVGAYQQKIAEGLEMAHGNIDFIHVASYHDAPKYIDALVRRVRDGIACWPEPERDQVHVVFSAHSLPARIIAAGDVYDAQCRDTAQRVAAGAELPDRRWSWSYQSAGRSPEPWLGPAIEDHIGMLAGTGVRHVLSVPVGFVSDHVEVLYDIDIKAREHAFSLGVRLERVPMLNDDPLFIEALAETVETHASAWLRGTVDAA
ncbi:MAG: ferrochelatase [Cyanobacteria bacterium]|nr:ferrochelatase [Cyanobacteriota bacterium]